MGTPDLFEYQCLNCGNNEASQTKLFGNDLKVFKPGDILTSCRRIHENCILELKEPCFNCKNQTKILILKKKYIGVVSFEPTIQELPMYKWRKL